MTVTAESRPATEAPPGAGILRRDPSLLDPVYERLRERVESGAIPGAALAFGDAEGEIRSETFSSGARPLSRDSNFFLASVTKPIFATAFMQLVETGRIGLHEPIQRLLPEFAGERAKSLVTPWHLLTHTSGVPDIEPDVIRRTRPSAAQMTALTIAAPLRFEPGSRYEYCSASFYLLGRLIERVTGIPYVRYLDDHLLGPLGMQATFDPRRSTRPIAAVHGVGAENRVIRFLLLRYLARAAVPGGGLFGTLDDLLRFGAAVLRPVVGDGGHVPLAPETIVTMISDQTRGISGTWEGEERRVHFGLGWGKPTLMRELPGSERVVSHGGATGTRLWIDPDAGLVICFFTNQWSPDRGPEVEAIRATYELLSRT